jgi:hypothetical protein
MSIDKSGYNTGSEAEFYPPSQATGAPYAPLAGQGQYAQVQSVQGTYTVNPVQGTYAQPAYAQPSYSVQPAQFAAQGYAATRSIAFLRPVCLPSEKPVVEGS